MVDEEVVQLIGSHQVFGLLLDGAVGLGRNQFGADGRIHHVEQDVAYLRIVGVGSLPCHEVAYKGLRYAGVQSVHRHVVAIVCGPSECQLREVARTYDDGVLAVGHVHEQLGALAGLAVLIRGVV